MRRAFATILALLALTANAAAADLRGKVVYEQKPDCQNLPADIAIRTSGTVAEIQLGSESRGLIPIDPATGNFLEKMTDSRLTIAGSVTDGALADAFAGNCIGRFKTVEQPPPQ